ncbi:MAG: serine/threonine protein kinase [Myxococcales bacterium FL481]|nr:MAG: serine/threonine protein kinase [Myxococcales bacterium FL481]
MTQELVRARLFGEMPTPVQIGRFNVIERIGVGGMGVVYAGYDADLDRKVALKRLHAPSRDNRVEARGRLRREAQAMARLSHPNVVPVYEVGLDDGQLFLVMEYVDGVTLAQWMQQRRRTVASVLDVFVQAARGLAAAHDAGLVHRDFKPENVLVDRHGRARVVDFGLARGAPATDDTTATYPGALARSADRPAWHEALTRTGSVAGTPAYMAPEQQDGGVVDARADQFSFCLALHEALHRVMPRGGATPLRSARTQSDGVDATRRWQWVPRRVRRALARGLQLDPRDRFGSMHELVHQLEPRPRWRQWTCAVASAGMAALAGTVVAWPWSCPHHAYGSVERRPRSGLAPEPHPPEARERGSDDLGRDSALGTGDGAGVVVAGHRTRAHLVPSAGFQCVSATDFARPRGLARCSCTNPGWWGGRPARMAGIAAGVDTVSPTHRDGYAGNRE